MRLGRSLLTPVKDLSVPLVVVNGNPGGCGDDRSKLPSAQKQTPHPAAFDGASNDSRRHKILTQVRSAIAVIQIRVFRILELIARIVSVLGRS